jgi:uncharacterized membrane protein
MAESPTEPPQPPSGQPPNQPPHIQIPSGGVIPQGALPQLIAAMVASAAQPQQLLLPGIIQQQAIHWQGPYPPPEAVERYEHVLPGTFDRLITMAEQLQTAQISQSAKALEYAHADTNRGQWLGFATTGFAMVGAIICAKIGEPWVAGLFLSVPVMAVARALIETTKAPSPTDIIKAATQPHQAQPETK